MLRLYDSWNSTSNIKMWCITNGSKILFLYCQVFKWKSYFQNLSLHLLVMKWILSFEKCFQSFFLLVNIILCLISTFTSSFTGLFLASLCLILLNFRALQVPKRSIAYILFPALWWRCLFVAHWCFHSHAQEKACSSFCMCKYTLCVTYANTFVHIYIFVRPARDLSL